LCAFEFEDGQRAEYDVGQRQYAQIVEGDTGQLETRGDRFRDFRRQTRPVKMGSRDLVLETTPLEVAKWGSKPWTLCRLSEQLLVLKPSPHFRLTAVFFLFFGALPLWASVSNAVWGNEHPLKLVLAALVGCTLLLIGVGLWVVRRREFDL